MVVFSLKLDNSLTEEGLSQAGEQHSLGTLTSC